MAKETRIAFRASEELKQRLQRASKKVKLGETALAEAAVEAAIEYIEKHGGIWLPLVVVPEFPADFGGAGEKTNAGAGGLSSDSTARFSPDTLAAPAVDLTLNETPPTAPAKTSKPRETRARKALREMTAREKRKP